MPDVSAAGSGSGSGPPAMSEHAPSPRASQGLLQELSEVFDRSDSLETSERSVSRGSSQSDVLSSVPDDKRVRFAAVTCDPDEGRCVQRTDKSPQPSPRPLVFSLLTQFMSQSPRQQASPANAHKLPASRWAANVPSKVPSKARVPSKFKDLEGAPRRLAASNVADLTSLAGLKNSIHRAAAPPIAGASGSKVASRLQGAAMPTAYGAARYMGASFDVAAEQRRALQLLQSFYNQQRGGAAAFRSPTSLQMPKFGLKAAVEDQEGAISKQVGLPALHSSGTQTSGVWGKVFNTLVSPSSVSPSLSIWKALTNSQVKRDKGSASSLPSPAAKRHSLSADRAYEQVQERSLGPSAMTAGNSTRRSTSAMKACSPNRSCNTPRLASAAADRRRSPGLTTTYAGRYQRHLQSPSTGRFSLPGTRRPSRDSSGSPPKWVQFNRQVSPPPHQTNRGGSPPNHVFRQVRSLNHAEATTEKQTLPAVMPDDWPQPTGATDAVQLPSGPAMRTSIDAECAAEMSAADLTDIVVTDLKALLSALSETFPSGRPSVPAPVANTGSVPEETAITSEDATQTPATDAGTVRLMESNETARQMCEPAADPAAAAPAALGAVGGEALLRCMSDAVVVISRSGSRNIDVANLDMVKHEPNAGSAKAAAPDDPMATLSDAFTAPIISAEAIAQAQPPLVSLFRLAEYIPAFEQAEYNTAFGQAQQARLPAASIGFEGRFATGFKPLRLGVPQRVLLVHEADDGDGDCPPPAVSEDHRVAAATQERPMSEPVACLPCDMLRPPAPIVTPTAPADLGQGLHELPLAPQVPASSLGERSRARKPRAASQAPAFMYKPRNKESAGYYVRSRSALRRSNASSRSPQAAGHFVSLPLSSPQPAEAPGGSSIRGTRTTKRRGKQQSGRNAALQARSSDNSPDCSDTAPVILHQSAAQAGDTVQHDVGCLETVQAGEAAGQSSVQSDCRAVRAHEQAERQPPASTRRSADSHPAAKRLRASFPGLGKPVRVLNSGYVAPRRSRTPEPLHLDLAASALQDGSCEENLSCEDNLKAGAGLVTWPSSSSSQRMKRAACSPNISRQSSATAGSWGALSADDSDAGNAPGSFGTTRQGSAARYYVSSPSGRAIESNCITGEAAASPRPRLSAGWSVERAAKRADSGLSRSSSTSVVSPFLLVQMPDNPSADSFFWGWQEPSPRSSQV